MRRLLLDSHVLLWWRSDNPTLCEYASGLIADSDNYVAASAVSVWEFRMKSARGKLSVPDTLEEATRRSGFAELPITLTTPNEPPPCLRSMVTTTTGCSWGRRRSSGSELSRETASLQNTVSAWSRCEQDPSALTRVVMTSDRLTSYRPLRILSVSAPRPLDSSLRLCPRAGVS